MASKVARMKKIFRPDGRALVAVLDHASGMGPAPGIVDPRPTVEKLVAGGVDAIATSFGTAVKCSDLLDHVGLILRVDGGMTAMGSMDAGMKLLFTVEDGLRIGADGLICMGYCGEGEADNLPYLATLGSMCEEWGVPLLAEMLARPKGGGRSIDPKQVTLAARIGAEYGADMIKTTYTGDPESFKMVTGACLGLPVLILGGAKMNSDQDVLETVKGALEGGASGVAMGRNLWSHEHPDKIAKAVRAIIHDGATVSAALKHMR
jgi:DhnA family fructose-bisphosphate aldolase class Ia